MSNDSRKNSGWNILGAAAIMGVSVLAGAAAAFFVRCDNKVNYLSNNFTCEICKKAITEDCITLPCEHTFHRRCKNMLEKEGHQKCIICLQ